jgi:hypothetical protein
VSTSSIRRAVANLAIAAAAVLLVGSIAARVGRAGELASALDGHRAYDAVGAVGAPPGDPSARPRSLVDLIARTATDSSSSLRIPLAILAQAINLPGEEISRTLETLNLVYAAMLAWLLCALLDRYRASTAIKAIAVLGAFASVPLARVPAYQPANLDLGACLFVTLAVYAIVGRSRWAVIPAAVLAVLAREVGLLVILFGLWRDWRRGVSRLTSIATYAPAVIAFVAFQLWTRADMTQGPGLAGELSRLALFERPQLLFNPSFLLLGAYHAATLFGGVSVVLLARALSGRLPIGEETEWRTYLVALLVISIVAGLGVWQVLAFGLPAIAVLFAKASATDDWRLLALQVGLATLCTQQPWARMSDVDYLAAVMPQLPVARSVFDALAARLGWIVHVGLVVWLLRWIMRDGRRSRLVACGLGAAAMLALLGDLSGRIDVSNGYGFDGEVYVKMLQTGYESGNPSTRLRPVVLAINGAVDRQVFDDPVATFAAMNLVYAFLLAVTLADLCRRYGASWEATAAFIVSLFLCISTAKMFAYYPTLVDLGAYAFMAAGVWAIVDGRRLAIVVTSVVAVLSREFAAINVLFGVVRDLRLRRSVSVVAATYAPAAVAFFALRRFAAGYASPTGGQEVLAMNSLSASLLANVKWWLDPTYAMFWLYFAVTAFGGLSLFLLTTLKPWRTCMRREPEWLALIGPLLVVAALGYVDMWRYIAFVLPALPPLWAWGVSGVAPSRLTPLLLTVSAATIVTQRPWQSMNIETYFRDWFPYYVVLENRAEAAHELWPAWGYYLVAALISLAAIAVVKRVGVTSRAATAGAG